MSYEISNLLNEYRINNSKNTKNPKRIVFKGTVDKDIYNISAPFKFLNEIFILGRVESRDSEYSEIGFFKKNGDEYVLDTNAPMLKLQDPFFTFINNELILGGVEVSPSPTNKDSLIWKTVFYKGTDFGNVNKFFEGPTGMKDLRIIELKDGSIGVFTRPQGKKGGRGKIGFYIANSLFDLSEKDIEAAPLLDLFNDDEWGGVNEVHVLDEDNVGILGHIANFSGNDERHYYSMAFIFNTRTKEVFNLKIIAERKNLLDGPSKRDDLIDVIFSGGLICNENGNSTIYVGVSDADAQYVEIPYPFHK